eukprot:gene16737-biopygen14129
MDEFEKLKKKRSLYRRSATNLVKRVREVLRDEPRDAVLLKKYLVELKEIQGTLKDFDERILDFIIEYEDEDGEKEMDDAMDYRDKIIGAIVSTEKQLEKIAENESIASGPRGRRDSLESIQSVRSDDSQGTTMKKKNPVKLPALELSKFSGKIHEWKEPARSVIAGIPTTDSSYETAVNLLKSRYANPAVIQRAHINQLLNLAPVFNEKNTARLRSFHDHIETHFRGLEALGVDK